MAQALLYAHYPNVLKIPPASPVRDGYRVQA
jgi:hypothetical protein